MSARARAARLISQGTQTCTEQSPLAAHWLAGWLAGKLQKDPASASPALNLGLHSDVPPPGTQPQPGHTSALRSVVKTGQGQVPNGVAHRSLCSVRSVSKDLVTRHPGPFHVKDSWSRSASGKATAPLRETTAESRRDWTEEDFYRKVRTSLVHGAETAPSSSQSEDVARGDQALKNQPSCRQQVPKLQSCVCWQLTAPMCPQLPVGPKGIPPPVPGCGEGH